VGPQAPGKSPTKWVTSFGTRGSVAREAAVCELHSQAPQKFNSFNEFSKFDTFGCVH
jgi:hypothetical protein